MGEKSCANCFNAWLVKQVRLKLWSPPRDARVAMLVCARCSRFPIPAIDEWEPAPEADRDG